MTTTSTHQLQSALEWRYATKQFDAARKIDESTLLALTESLRLAPSSFGLQPWKFFLIENPELRLQLRAHSWNQSQVTDASHLIVLAVKQAITHDDVAAWMEQLANIQNTPTQSLSMLSSMIHGFTSQMDAAQMLSWNTRQVYIALGQLMTSAALLGIDSCPLEGITPHAYDGLLGLENSGYTTAVACAVGFRSSEDKYATIPKARKSSEQVMIRL